MTTNDINIRPLTDQKVKRLREVYAENNLLPKNLENILDYKDHRKKKLADETVSNDLKALTEFSKMVKKPFNELTVKDLDSYFDYLDSHNAPMTVRLYKAKLRLFFTYNKRPDLADNCVSANSKSMTKLPEDILTTEDMEKMINATQNLRDKALIAFLFESGARRGEFLDIEIKHIKFDADGCVVTLPKGKTGPRRIRLVYSTGYLQNWLNNHPDKNNRNALVWSSIKYDGKRMGYRTLWGTLKRIADKAGVQKKVNPHSFRHAAGTRLAGFLTEQQLKVYLGWTAGSNMAQVYVHLSGKDVDDAILRAYGKKPVERTEIILKTVTCSRCKQLQESTATFCLRCGLPLNATANIEENKTQLDVSHILQNEAFMALLTEQLQKQVLIGSNK